MIKCCPHCSGNMEVRDINDKILPEVGLKCTICPISFFLCYDKTVLNRENTLDMIIKAWNKRIDESKVSKDMFKQSGVSVSV